MIGLGPKIAKFEFATKIKFVHNDKEFFIKDIAAGPQHVAAIDGNFEGCMRLELTPLNRIRICMDLGQIRRRSFGLQLHAHVWGQ